MKTQADYLKLLTSQHRDKPLFTAAVMALVDGILGTTNTTLDMPDDFDLDRAQGVQLDQIGLWVGIGRFVPSALIGIYFTWDSTEHGWEAGYWRGPFDPLNGVTSVDDDTYRTLIRAKIAANIWDGTLFSMYGFWELVFGKHTIFIQDNQDMTMTLIYDSTKLTPIEVALLTGGYFDMKPSGVRVLYASLSSAPLFAWDRNTATFKGWGQGEWSASAG